MRRQKSECQVFWTLVYDPGRRKRDKRRVKSEEWRVKSEEWRVKSEECAILPLTVIGEKQKDGSWGASWMRKDVEIWMKFDTFFCHLTNNDSREKSTLPRQNGHSPTPCAPSRCKTTSSCERRKHTLLDLIARKTKSKRTTWTKIPTFPNFPLVTDNYRSSHYFDNQLSTYSISFPIFHPISERSKSAKNTLINILNHLLIVFKRYSHFPHAYYWISSKSDFQEENLLFWQLDSSLLTNSILKSDYYSWISSGQMLLYQKFKLRCR